MRALQHWLDVSQQLPHWCLLQQTGVYSPDWNRKEKEAETGPQQRIEQSQLDGGTSQIMIECLNVDILQAKK